MQIVAKQHADVCGIYPDHIFVPCAVIYLCKLDLVSRTIAVRILQKCGKRADAVKIEFFVLEMRKQKMNSAPSG